MKIKEELMSYGPTLAFIGQIKNYMIYKMTLLDGRKVDINCPYCNNYIKDE